MKKKALSLILAIAMLFSLMPTVGIAASAEDLGTTLTDDSFSVCVNPYGGDRDSIDTIEWFESESLGHYLFLPADCDTGSMKLYLSGADSVYVNGKLVSDGETTDVFKSNGLYVVKCGNNTYNLTVMSSENIPAVYINTKSGSLETIHAGKDNKEKGDIRIYSEGALCLDKELKQIKGRGNSTWYNPKKPYNIKFDKSTSVLGMDKAKKWTLLASVNDPAMTRNPVAWYLAEKTGLKYTSDYRIIDLYINHDYLGTYIICESVEVGENRIDIYDLTGATEDVNSKDLDKYSAGGSGEGGTVQTVTEYPNQKWVNIPENPEYIEGGYLLECDQKNRYDSEVSGFVTERAQAVVVKEPEYASQKQVEYISNYWQEAEDALYSPDGKNSLGKHYSEYFDMDSLVNMYILQEFSGNIDGGITSTFFYKDMGGKLVASPAWDYDNAFGNSFTQMGYNFADTEMWTANRLDYNGVESIILEDECPTVFNLLYRHEDFRELVSERWAALSPIYGGKETTDFITNTANTAEASCIMNGVRWNGVYTKLQHNAQMLTTVNFVINKTKALDKGFGENAAQLYYDVNGGKGWMFDSNIYENGDLAVVRALTFERAKVTAPSGSYYFAGWNTKPDGSGQTYLPGMLIELNGTVTLYAQWKLRSGASPDDQSSPEYNRTERISNFLLDNTVFRFLNPIFTRIFNIMYRNSLFKTFLK